jgi:hypothetical protein
MKALCLNTKKLCPELYVLHKNVNIVHALAAMFYPFEIVDFHNSQFTYFCMHLILLIS